MSSAALALAAAISILAQGASPTGPGGPDLYTEVGDCLQGVATQFKTEPFDTMVDRAVERCGPMIPFPVPPIERPDALKPDHTQAIRTHITFRLRQIIKADPSRGVAKR